MWKVAYQLKRQSGPITGVAINGDGSFAVTSCEDESISLYSLIGEEHHLCYLGCPVLTVDVACLKDAIASGASDGVVRVHSQTLDVVSELKMHRMAVQSVHWNKAGDLLASGGHDGNCFIWGIKQGNVITEFPKLKGWVRGIDWNGDMIAVVGGDPLVRVIDPRTGKESHKLSVGGVEQTSVSFSRCGHIIASAGFDGRIRIWDLRTSALLRRQRVHSETVTSVSFSNSSDDILTTSTDGTARLWNLRSPTLLQSFSQHKGSVTVGTFFPGGISIATCGSDGKLVFTRNEVAEIDGEQFANGMDRLQRQLEQITKSIKILDARLLAQEEKVEWLAANDEVISYAAQRRR